MTERFEQRLNPARRRAPPRYLGVAAALATVTLAQLAYSVYVRYVENLGAPALQLTRLEFDATTVGLALQEIVIPTALLSLIAGRPFFKRHLVGRARLSDRIKLFVTLLLIQLLFFAYLFGLDALGVGQVTLGYLTVMVAGFVGGWSQGLLLGALTFALLGSRDLIAFPPEALAPPEVLRYYFAYNLEAASALWVGLAAGFSGPLLRRWRFAPLSALGLGIAIGALARYFAALALSDPDYWLAILVPSTLVTGLALAVVGLIVRNALAEDTRHQAEAGKLALAQAELRALRAQINPHFLFNSLNTIRYFVRTDPEVARDLLVNLSEVFQRALRSGDFVTLDGELSYVRAYLALEQARLGKRLRVAWIIPDKRLLAARVPTLVLQPLVENAVIHGLSKKPEGGTLAVSIRRLHDDLELLVQDDGVGFDPLVLEALRGGVGRDGGTAHVVGLASAESVESGLRGGSIGLSNIDHRLRMIYGDGYRLEVESEPGVGSAVVLTLPLDPFADVQESWQEEPADA